MTRFPAVVAAVILLTVVRIATTYLVFSQTVDEPVHIGAGHQWLTSHARSYGFDPEHPPLARAVFALPFIHITAKTHVRPSQIDHALDRVDYGNDLLENADRYMHNLAKARRGNILFVVLTLLFVALIGRKLLGDAAAIVATILFASLPPFLAHGGLATTDVPAVAGFALAFYALLEWCDAPTWPHTFFLALAMGIGVLCKYSFIPFFGLAAVITVIVRRRRLPVRKMVTALVLSFVIIWAAFDFSFDTLRHEDPDTPRFARVVLKNEHAADYALPAPAFFAGLLQVKHHDKVGHPNFLLGKESQKGWWYYFPLVLALKTPIAFLILAAVGAWFWVRRRQSIDLVLIPFAILGFAMTSSINIGIRHLLPIYVPLAIVAADGALELWRRSRVVAGLAVAWIVIGSALAHPDYIPWMNAFAGRHPETVLEDSNFDWGQDIWRMVRVLRKRGIDRIGYALFTDIRPSSVHYTNGYILDPQKKSSAWIVVSEQKLQLAVAEDPTAYQWLTRRYAFDRIGKTIRLYHVP